MRRSKHCLAITPISISAMFDYQVARSLDRYMSAGAGELVALGALFALAVRYPTPNPTDIVVTALKAAARYSTSVSGLFLVVSDQDTQTVAEG